MGCTAGSRVRVSCAPPASSRPSLDRSCPYCVPAVARTSLFRMCFPARHSTTRAVWGQVTCVTTPTDLSAPALPTPLAPNFFVPLPPQYPISLQLRRLALTTGTPSDPFSGVRRDMVEAVTSAFPNEPLPNVIYSLSRTRSAQATSEIILERGSLPNVSPVLWRESAQRDLGDQPTLYQMELPPTHIPVTCVNLPSCLTRSSFLSLARR